MTAIIPLVFWVVDGSLRRIQRTFICRIEEISDFVNSSKFKTAAEKGSPLDFPLLVMRRKVETLQECLVGHDVVPFGVFLVSRFGTLQHRRLVQHKRAISSSV
jgi:hypothetical protein